jgi:tRNA-dihydrouridine synthase
MQDVTTAGFMGLVADIGAPDFFFTEFIRVHSQTRPETLEAPALEARPGGRPVFAQLIGNDPALLARAATALLARGAAGIDLNLGCPAPKVFRKNVGGGLLRDLPRVDEILAALREAVPGVLSVKTRVGFESAAGFDDLLGLLAKRGVNLVSLHGRTVAQLYRGPVDHALIARAVGALPCPVLANGEITSAAGAARVLGETGAAGVMLGRHAIRNPWVFAQLRAVLADKPPPVVTLGDVRRYVDQLAGLTRRDGAPDRAHANRVKKFLNFTGQSVDPGGRFLNEMRRARTVAELLAVCDRHLLAEPDAPFALEPFPGVVARPNCEG